MLSLSSKLLSVLTEVYTDAQKLAQMLGVSAGELAEAARALGEEGYPLLTSPAGLRLAAGTPTPQALEMRLGGAFGRPYVYLGRAGSTQDEVRKLAAEMAPEGAVVLAEAQEKGRGRRGRVWTSQPGGSLTFSLLLRPRLDSPRLPLLALAAGLALCEACGVGGLKWPNDLLAPGGRKLAGILLEAQFAGGSPSYAVLGIGLNVYPPVPEGAAALAEFGSVSRVELLARILGRLEARYTQLQAGPQAILDDYRPKCLTLGREVAVAVGSRRLQGRALDVAEDGALLLESEGTVHRISAGDAEMVGLF